MPRDRIVTQPSTRSRILPTRTTLPGVPYPLGATLDSEGVNFALYSEGAERVELCLFDDDDAETRIPVNSRTAFVWHTYVSGIGAGTRYGYRVHGPYDPEHGLRFNPQVVLLDPYAKATDGVERWDRGCFAYRLGSPREDLEPEASDQLGARRAVVVDTSFDWEDDAPLGTALHRSVIYEAHVKGLTVLHPDVPLALRGTYSGVAHPAIVRHLRDLGVTAIELMPVHAFVDEKHLIEKGLRNYWGYSSIGFFAPDPRYRSGSVPGGEVAEFKTMVKVLHRAGIEVILDVVYNHTAEGNHLGPSLNFKGIDNKTYYRLVPGQPRYYFDYTGTGNTLNVRHPQVLALIMDSLRYWASEMHVDGFRFDLASSLARQLHEVDQLSSFFTLIHQSPNLRHAKIIAEPWDVGEGGYQVGNFPVRWAEWNGRYRDAVRSLWRGDGGRAAEIGYRLTGSSDLYESSGRRPSASINLVTAHDGAPMRDLVTYQDKHNEANGEGNRDGSDNEYAWNCGIEGDTDDPAIRTLRRRQQRNLLATLFLSQGTPMLLAGDELGRTQRGNNNAYCQDNEISWIDWNLDDDQRALLEFTRRLLALRRAHPALHRANFFQGRGVTGTELHDIRWFRHDGKPMSEADWHNQETRTVGMFLAGRGIDDEDETGRPIVDDDLFILINASPLDVDFAVPSIADVSEAWQLVLDTADDAGTESARGGDATHLVARSIKFFRAPSRVVRHGGVEHSLVASYRLQLNAGFGFQDAHALTSYIHELGATDVYTSPLMRAGRGSTHGYDVVDHSRLNPELGTEAQFDVWTAGLATREMGLLLDWVPNHMGIASGQNAWWDDVLENGPSSAYADHFDIDWAPPKHGLADRVLLPILGTQYGEALDAGDIRLVWEDGQFKIAYVDHRLPVGPKTLVPILDRIVVTSALSADHPLRQELESIGSAMRHLPDRGETTHERRQERAREKEVIKRRLRSVVAASPQVAAAVASTLDELHGVPGRSESLDTLDRLLAAQSYRLASWKVASEEINYRRFFDINDLAAVRMESSEVFDHAHDYLFRLIEERKVNALRLDHTDGLYDPLAYFEALQRRFKRPSQRFQASPDDLARPLPIFVEKILEPGERLPSTWPVDGTTGYEFASAVTGLWVEPGAELAFTRLYKQFTGDARAFSRHVYESKLHILRYSLASEVNMLARSLERLAAMNRRWRDFTLISLTRALTEVLAAFPVYRTYLQEGNLPNEHDIRQVAEAMREARKRNPALNPTLFTFLEDVLLLRTAATDAERDDHVRFALRFQQLSGPVTAKSVEDTAFYRYHRLVCLNEVGSSPGSFGETVDGFHDQNAERIRAWPLGMVSTATHDSKRGEDTGARIAVLTEMPNVWRRAVIAFSAASERVTETIDGEQAPSRELEYLFYQSLIGACPAGWDGTSGREELARRLGAFVVKASKEAKQQTSWNSPNPDYDAAVARFVPAMFTDEAFIQQVVKLCEVIAPHGASNGLGQTLLRICSPGVPDTYQGCELWNQSLVDPDNRRPVDYAPRKTALAEIRTRHPREARTLVHEWLSHFEDGRIKLLILHLALVTRRERRDLFLHGDYEPIGAGPHVVAFTRARGKERMLCAATRFSYLKTRGERPFAIGDVWGDERLRVPYPGIYRNVLTRETVAIESDVALAELFKDLPVALLVLEPTDSAR